ncbi:DEAD/DEAH box helicase [Curvibacter sp. CHRR-16]|uniref:DEAD/DEAH box helicase n=1 Tax=Curvibacter sp. CHRR-16 TaxID=2835872 RepID=UPI001BD98907|nr:DEAD/DEAH box helicase [Curvibacter sp. CHRR-16]MBT0570533.1 DEAD/DEAH box helicase [Curvibacter sp. CHRR-16]
MPFAALGLSPALAQACATLGFAQPTPVQSATLPAALAGRDVLASAQTGSGKTLAFGLPLLQRLQMAATPALLAPKTAPRGVGSLVLAPTRELAQQVRAVLAELAHAAGLRVRIVTAVGGVSINPQMMALRGGCDVLVATPGRLLDLAQHNAIQLHTVGLLVLDEADRLLDLGFAAELQDVLQLLPRQRQTVLTSATFPTEVENLANSLLRDPVRVQVQAAQAAPVTIVQRAIRVDAKARTQLLRTLIEREQWGRALVFVATQYAAEHVASKLFQAGVRAAPFHGELSQGARQAVLEDFKDQRLDVVVTTDLAARGIDILKLPVVVNYDLPRSTTDYTHRIGRTGRAGEAGLAVNFVTADALAHWKLIEKRQGMALALEEVADFAPTEVVVPVVMPTGPNNGGVKGKRPSKKDKLRAAGLLPPLPQ